MHSAEKNADVRNEEQKPVLVIGGTGRTGRLVVEKLLREGYRVRVLTRTPHSPTNRLDRRVDLVAGDLRSAASVAAASRGVEAIVMAHGSDDGTGTAKDIDYGGVARTLESIANARVRVVLLSSIYVTRPKHPANNGNPVFAWKAAAEELLRSSGQPHTIVRASWLTSQPGRGLSSVRLEQDDKGEGSISMDDLAEILVAALCSPSALSKTFEAYGDDIRYAGHIDTRLAALVSDTPTLPVASALNEV